MADGDCRAPKAVARWSTAQWKSEGELQRRLGGRGHRVPRPGLTSLSLQGPPSPAAIAYTAFWPSQRSRSAQRHVCCMACLLVQVSLERSVWSGVWRVGGSGNGEPSGDSLKQVWEHSNTVPALSLTNYAQLSADGALSRNNVRQWAGSYQAVSNHSLTCGMAR